MTEFSPTIDIAPDAAAAADRAALFLIAALHGPESACLGLATGATMIPVYAALVAAYRADEVSFRGAETFNLDEYVGLGPDHPGSFRRYMRRHLFDRVDIEPDLAHVPNGLAEDTAAEAARFETTIGQAGGIELQILGIGTNGHIGFNEPGSSFSSRTREIELDEATRRANAASFPGQDLAPARAITMGIATILEARRILLLATGAEKAEAIAAAIEGPLTTDCPASALRLHRNVHVICDEAAARLVDRTLPSPRHSGPAPQGDKVSPQGASRNDGKLRNPA